MNKNILKIQVLLLAFAALMIQSCTIEDADESVSPNAEKLDIVSDINVQPTTTTTKFEVKSDVSWNITTDIDGSWEGLSVSPTSGTGNTEVTITTGENTTRKDRTAKLMVTTKGGVAQELVLRQLQSEPLLEVTSGTGQSLEFEAVSEASKNIAISCNTYWEIACDNWITCSKMEGTNESLTVTNVSVNVTEAQTDTVRLGAITVMAEGGKIAKINVSQQGKVIELSVSPQNFDVVATGDKKTIQITCNAAWKLNYDEGNILCNVTEGTGTQNVEVTCLPNDQPKERKVTLNVISGIAVEKKETVSFTQAAATPPELGEFELIQSSIKKNEATFRLKFNTMFPLSRYGVYVSKKPNLSGALLRYAENPDENLNELEFTLTGLESMTTYYVYGYIYNSVGEDTTKGRIELTFTTAGVKPSDDDNPTPSLTRR